MYFPHLFARRAELLALRHVSAELPILATVAPILEPLKSDSTDLRRCLEILGEAAIRTIVIVNPTNGDFRQPTEVEPWRQSLTAVFANYPTLLPGFVCRASTSQGAVEQFMQQYPTGEVAMLYWSPALNTQAIQALVHQARIRFHINLHGQMSAAHRALLPNNKAVDVVDHFNHLPRNADYQGQEFFSDDHLDFQATGIGFGDYSVIGSRFVAGGGPAHAVAIHAVYQAEDGSVWVEHFVSDDTDADVGTVEEKYLQAAAKLVEAVGDRPNEFGNDTALNGYADDVEDENFPGLAMNKRRQIHHHIALNHHLLGGD